MPVTQEIQEIKTLIETCYPGKLAEQDELFAQIHPGDRIFISTACGEPQQLVKLLIEYVESNPKAFFDAEVIHVWTLGLAPYTDEKFKSNFRLKSFFISSNTRDAVNRGGADYAPLFLSQVPSMFRRGLVPVDVALIQTSPPDTHGFLSLGVSVDISKAAIEAAPVVIAQINPRMPRVHGNSFIHMDEVTHAVLHEEPLLTYLDAEPDEVSLKIGKYVARIIEDGDVIQVGYGRIPNAILSSLKDKRNLGVHTELFSEGIAELMKSGVVNNTKKNVDRHKSVASFCMGTPETYRYIHDNPAVEFRPVDYTNNPLILAQIERMTALNAALEVDLTGQATAESIGTSFYSGIGGQADFMRGAVLAPGGKTILTLPSTAGKGTVSRIVSAIGQGAGITLTRGDIHYVVTEYGIAYLFGKSIRERAMALIAIAHPKFRSQLIKEAKQLNLIYKDQAFVPGKRGEYPEHLEVRRTTGQKLNILLRPVRISDEPLLKDFFYSLTDESVWRRFMSVRKDMPHERLQEFVIIDYTKEMVILAVITDKQQEKVVGLGQYGIEEDLHSAELAFVVRDDMQKQGVGTELLNYLTYLAKMEGLLGFTAEVLFGNEPMLRLFEKGAFDVDRRLRDGVFELTAKFRNE